MDNILDEIKKLDISEEVFKEITKIAKKHETVFNPNSLYYHLIQILSSDENLNYNSDFHLNGLGVQSHINNIDNLDVFPNIKSIIFGSDNSITDWTPLLKLKNLKELLLNNNENTNIEVLLELKSLEKIRLNIYDNNDLKFIEKFNGEIILFFNEFDFENYDKELLKQIYLRNNIMFIIDDGKEYKKLDNFINSIKDEIENS